ncbi:MAG: response regulator transcription factor [Dehalococcoidia bacterium]|nr:response regulator transcription factor [Dehalococcoidia bacterium]
MKALLVGDSEDLAQTVSLFLRVRWPELSLFSSVETREVIELVYRERPDVVMLQHGVASVDCFDLITQIRSFTDVAIIVLGRSDDVIDKVKVLEMGADDWISPSSMPMEFIAKVNAVLRRSLPRSNERMACFLNDEVSIDCASHEVCVLGKQVKLTPIECKILCRLISSEGRVVSCTDLLHCAWGPDYRADPEFLKKYIYRLRCKLEDDHGNPQIIITERGMGYSFVAPCNSDQKEPISTR